MQQHPRNPGAAARGRPPVPFRLRPGTPPLEGLRPQNRNKPDRHGTGIPLHAIVNPRFQRKFPRAAIVILQTMAIFATSSRRRPPPGERDFRPAAATGPLLRAAKDSNTNINKNNQFYRYELFSLQFFRGQEAGDEHFGLRAGAFHPVPHGHEHDRALLARSLQRNLRIPGDLLSLKS